MILAIIISPKHTPWSSSQLQYFISVLATKLAFTCDHESFFFYLCLYYEVFRILFFGFSFFFFSDSSLCSPTYLRSLCKAGCLQTSIDLPASLVLRVKTCVCHYAQLKGGRSFVVLKFSCSGSLGEGWDGSFFSPH